MLNRELPHQVLVLSDSIRGHAFNCVMAFHDEAGVPVRNCTVRKDDKWYLRFFFAERKNAVAFQLAFGGELLNQS